MTSITCPHNELTLKIALMGIGDKFEDPNFEIKFKEIMSDIYTSDNAILNKKISEFNGISVLDLINSPNYTVLKEEFFKASLVKAINSLKEDGFSDKESWALIMAATGNLNL